MLVGNVADLGDRRNVAVHRVDALEGDELRPRRVHRGEQTVEIGRVVVAEDVPVGARVADALYHRGMVLRVGEDGAVREFPCERAEGGPVRHVTGGEEERCRLAVEVGEGAFEFHVVVVGAGDVARSARAGAAPVQRLVHRVEHLRVLAHAEIVVGAPHGDFLRAATFMVALGPRKRAAPTLEVREDAIIAGVPKSVEAVGEVLFVVHESHPEAQV